MEHRADKKENKKAGECPFADETESHDQSEQKIVGHSPAFVDAHESPEARRNCTSKHHRVRYAFMQIPSELEEQEGREPGEDSEAALREDASGREVQEGDRAGEQPVLDEKKARQCGTRQLLHRPEQPFVERRLARHIAERERLGEDI